MKQVLLGTLLLLAVSAAAMAGSASNPDPEALWNRIAVDDPYTEWGQFPDHRGMQEGNAPHGQWHIVYVNEQAGSAGHPKDDGAVIVKENFGEGKTLNAITVMYKVDGYNPAAGDWFWVKYGPKGEVLVSGRPQGCISCHTAARDNDFIMTSEH